MALEATSSTETRTEDFFELFHLVAFIQPTFLLMLADWQEKKGKEEEKEGKRKKTGLLVSLGWVHMDSNPWEGTDIKTINIVVESASCTTDAPI